MELLSLPVTLEGAVGWALACWEKCGAAPAALTSDTHFHTSGIWSVQLVAQSFEIEPLYV